MWRNGIRSGLKSRSRKACGFNSHHPYVILTKRETEELLIEAAIKLNKIMGSGIPTKGLLEHRAMVKQIQADYPDLYKAIIDLMNRVESYDMACFYERHPEYSTQRN